MATGVSLQPHGLDPWGRTDDRGAAPSAIPRSRRHQQPDALPAAPRRRILPRPTRWAAAVTTMVGLQDEHRAWLDSLPDHLEESRVAEKLQAIVDLDLEELQAVDPPRGLRSRLRKDGPGPTPPNHHDQIAELDAHNCRSSDNAAGSSWPSRGLLSDDWVSTTAIVSDRSRLSRYSLFLPRQRLRSTHKHRPMRYRQEPVVMASGPGRSGHPGMTLRQSVILSQVLSRE
jgi:hypothetical protein